MTKWLIPLLLALAVVCTILFHIVLPLHDGIQINTVDAYCILRYADIWPNIPQHDFYLNYPDGQAPMSQMFWIVMIASVAKVFHLDVTTSGAILPPVLFLLTLIPVYIIARILFKDKLVATVSIFLLAIMPGELLNRTMIGAADYHCLEIFLTSMILMFALLAIEFRDSKGKLVIYVTSAFIFALAYAATWQGAPLVLLIMLIFLAIWHYRRWQIWVAGAVAAGAFLYFVPHAIEKVSSFFIPNMYSMASEALPLFFSNGHFDISAMIVYFSIAYFLALFGIGILLSIYIRKKNKTLLLFLVWSAVMLVITFVARRYAYYLSVNVAILTAFSCFYILRLMRRNRKVLVRTAIVLVVAICFVFGYRSTVTALSDYGTMPTEWQEATSWLSSQAYSEDNYSINHMPGRYYTGEDLGFGVLCHWNYGYWVVREGHMPASYTPGNWDGNATTFCKSNIDDQIQKNRWKYIVLDEKMFTSNSYQVFYSNGTNPEDTAVYNLFYFGIPVWQSSNGKVKIFETGVE